MGTATPKAMTDTRPLITLADLEAATKVLNGVALRTPLLYDEVLSERALGQSRSHR
jgi:hypothetical protein